MILVTNSPTTPCTFYFLSDRLVIRVIKLIGKHVDRDWRFVVGWRYESIRRIGPTFDKSRTMRMIRITCGDQGEMTVRLTGVSRFP